MRQHIHTCFDKIVNCDYVMEYGISGIAGDHSSVSDYVGTDRETGDPSS